MKQLLKYLSVAWAFLLSHAAIADNQCPDGNFNSYNSVCMCSGGGYVGPGEWCKRGDNTYGSQTFQIPQDLPSVERRLLQLNASQCSLTEKGNIFLDDGKGDRERRMRAADHGRPYMVNPEVRELLLQRERLSDGKG